jgi:hypothetical protein
MEVILQDVSPELLAAFTTFLPGDTHQEKKAKLHIAPSAASSSRMPIIAAAHEDEIQVVSATSDKHLDSDNDKKVQQKEGYPPA